MNWKRVPRLQPLGVVVGVVMGAIIVTGAGIASAHGGDTSRIHTCVNSSGLLKVVGPDGACGKNETALDWNQSGPAGPTGATGPAGDPAPGGVVGQYDVKTALDRGQTLSASCDVGDLALSATDSVGELAVLARIDYRTWTSEVFDQTTIHRLTVSCIDFGAPHS